MGPSLALEVSLSLALLVDPPPLSPEIHSDHGIVITYDLRLVGGLVAGQGPWFAAVPEVAVYAFVV